MLFDKPEKEKKEGQAYLHRTLIKKNSVALIRRKRYG
jgi:hypothetical protein